MSAAHTPITTFEHRTKGCCGDGEWNVSVDDDLDELIRWLSDCAYCGAARGAHCTPRNSGVRRTYPHSARWDVAVTAGLIDAWRKAHGISGPAEKRGTAS